MRGSSRVLSNGKPFEKMLGFVGAEAAARGRRAAWQLKRRGKIPAAGDGISGNVRLIPMSCSSVAENMPR